MSEDEEMIDYDEEKWDHIYASKHPKDIWDPKEGKYYNKRYVYPSADYEEHVFDAKPGPGSGGKSCQLCPFSYEHRIHIQVPLLEVEDLQDEIQGLQDQLEELQEREYHAQESCRAALESQKAMINIVNSLRDFMVEHSPSEEFTKCWKGTPSQDLPLMLRDFLVITKDQT